MDGGGLRVGQVEAPRDFKTSRRISVAKRKVQSDREMLSEARERVAALTGMLTRVWSVLDLEGDTQDERECNLNACLCRMEKEQRESRDPF